jgi:hypothetical protein
MLGYVVLGRRAIRLDLAEQVATLLQSGESERAALECLALPRRDLREVGGAFATAIGVE